MKDAKVIFFSILILLIMLSCNSKPRIFKYTGKIIPGKWLRNVEVGSRSYNKSEHVKIQIFFPKNYQKKKNFRTLICLHHYKGEMYDWEKNTDIEKYANDLDFILVCPNMKTTIYETRYYPQTTNKWNSIPGGKWIGEILIPFLREQFAIAYEKRRTGILGNSIGARGAILTASSFPRIFGAAAGLSGFYDTIAKTDNKLLIAIYGEYDNFPKRWEDDDNIIKLAVNLKDTPVFLAHGKSDWKVNFEQARLLAIRLKQLQKGNKNIYKFEYHEKKFKFHDWKLWNSMLPFMISFFDRNLERSNRM
ncbi:MAG: alpha/beta hydrolase-fold protein [Spirochaetota bacterium]|nr:alpha/beta hydrolase-fold protein [Spirochaetota bacterium]